MNIVSFYAPRPTHPFFQDYTPYLKILDASAKKYGHRHIIITDADLPGFETFKVPLVDNLMRAVLDGQLQYLQSPLAQTDTILIDGDCVLARDPAEVFALLDFDCVFTTHDYLNTKIGDMPFKDSHLNNGVMYIRGGTPAWRFWRKALDQCEPEWGGDQAALGEAVGATPKHGLYSRMGLAVRFLPEHPYNSVPKNPMDRCADAYVLHFRGPRKGWMIDYCAKNLGIGTPVENRVLQNTDDDELFANIRRNAALPLKWAAPQDAHEGHAVICGGGPSLSDTLEEIKWRASIGQTIFALNNAANYLKENGLEPDWQFMTDARPHNKKYISTLPAKRYLLGSQCHPSVIDAVPEDRVELIHCGGPGVYECLPPERKSFLVGGGLTSGLTAMCAVFMLGYRQIHLFGYDSSDREGESHAYAQTLTSAEQKRIKVWAGDREFTTQQIMAKQAEIFPSIASILISENAIITVHGDGLLPAIAKMMSQPKAELENVHSK